MNVGPGFERSVHGKKPRVELVDHIVPGPEKSNGHVQRALASQSLVPTAPLSDWHPSAYESQHHYSVPAPPPYRQQSTQDWPWMTRLSYCVPQHQVMFGQPKGNCRQAQTVTYGHPASANPQQVAYHYGQQGSSKLQGQQVMYGHPGESQLQSQQQLMRYGHQGDQGGANSVGQQVMPCYGHPGGLTVTQQSQYNQPPQQAYLPYLQQGLYPQTPQVFNPQAQASQNRPREVRKRRFYCKLCCCASNKVVV